MSGFACVRCGLSVESESVALSCPRCGGELQALHEPAPGGREGVLQSALDEIVERPGVRLFCTAMSSLVVHVGVFCLFMLITWAHSEAVAEEPAPMEVSMSLAVTDAPNDGSGFRFPGKTNLRDEEDAKRVRDALPKDGLVGAGAEDTAPASLFPSADPKAKGGGSGAVAGFTGIGAGSVGSNFAGIIGRGTSAGSAGRSGGGDGNGTGLGIGRRMGGGEIFGVQGLPGARKVVYVVDKSGSMDTIGDFLKIELSKAINKLNSTQQFNVIWFSDGEPYALAATLVPATEDNKQRLFKHLLEVKFSGQTDPRGALFKAMDLKPELIYVLTDGNFEDEFVETITKRNTGRIRINAIGFLLEGSGGHSCLQKLTERNTGTFKEINAVKLTGS